MGESVPTSFLLLEKQLSEEAANRIPPVISKPTLQQFASVVNITDERELSRASKTLHELGSIVHFDADPKLSDMVVLSPRWLTEMLATVFTTKHNFAKNGILPHSSLLQIWYVSSSKNSNTKQETSRISKQTSQITSSAFGSFRNCVFAGSFRSRKVQWKFFDSIVASN